MVITKYHTTRKDGVDLYLTKSDQGLKIRKLVLDRMGNPTETEEVYDEAIDVVGAPFMYVETDVPIETEQEEGETAEGREVI